jgi:hypothetical protein
MSAFGHWIQTESDYARGYVAFLLLADLCANVRALVRGFSNRK